MLEKGIIGLLLAGLAAMLACYPILWIYRLCCALVKGERFRGRIVDIEERPADRVACYAPVIEIEQGGKKVRVAAEPLIVLLPLFSRRRIRRKMLRWKERERVVLYARPFAKRAAYVCIASWIWMDIPIVALLVLLTAVALAVIMNL